MFSQSVDYGFKYKNPVDVRIDQFYLNKIDSLIKSKIYSRESTGTFSWGGYFYTHYWADPKENLIGVIMSQVAPTESSLNNEFQHLVYSSLMK